MLLIEQVVPEVVTADPAHEAMVRTDLIMLGVDGTDRAAVSRLPDEAGWRLTRIIPVDPAFSAIEARPA